MRWLFLLLLFCFATGCAAVSYHYTRHPTELSPKKIIPVWIDKKFGEGDKVDINDAIAQWNYAFNGQIKISIISHNFDMEPETIKNIYEYHGLMILQVDSNCSFIPVPLKPGAKTLAWADDIGGYKIFVVRDRIFTNDMLRSIMMHELGHILGATHVEGHHSLMLDEYYENSYKCIDKYSAQAVSTYQRIPFEKMNYCIYDGYE